MFLEIDKCNGLINICKERNYNVKQCVIENIDYPDNVFDFVMCIAVIHHLDTEEFRIKAFLTTEAFAKVGWYETPVSHSKSMTYTPFPLVPSSV